MDATRPKGKQESAKVFHQILTIHGLNNGYSVPLVLFLLANNHQTWSEVVFKYTVSNINNVEDQLDATVKIYWYPNQLNMFRAIFCPSSGAQDRVLQHVV